MICEAVGAALPLNPPGQVRASATEHAFQRHVGELVLQSMLFSRVTLGVIIGREVRRGKKLNIICNVCDACSMLNVCNACNV